MKLYRCIFPNSVIRIVLSALVHVSTSIVAQAQSDGSSNPHRKFEPLGSLLPTPNSYRTASGAPGHQYWQQKADYVISVELNDEQRSLSGSETVTYTNNSPDVLDYVWLQLDQNLFAKDSEGYRAEPSEMKPSLSLDYIKRKLERESFDGGYKLKAVTDASGKPLKYTVVGTMMRIDLPTPLRTGQKFVFRIDWSFKIVPKHFNARSNYEEFDDGCIYGIAQFFPRMAVYSDATGWQHKQFFGTGEFTLPFGDYKVSITVPDDHIVAATGTLQNAAQVLTPVQRERLKQAENASSPVKIVTQEEMERTTQSPPSNRKKTWIFQANNVRDFAFASSRKFIWDAMGVNIEGKKVMAMSFYPREGNPLWEQYSTRAVAHTLKVYSKHTFPYPYPVAISANVDIGGGMEYPMLSFNAPRPDSDGTYSERTKSRLLYIIFHEVGHNYFPMIVNSDERQWTWMDEGLNSFLQFLTEQEWDRNFPSEAGFPHLITDYMKAEKSKLTPIMTTSDNIPLHEFGSQSYDKPATALNILRETILGRELFDFAFKKYAQRWMFKHPQPADFFRTMEDASGVDLDWFWRGWFYGTEHTDIALNSVQRYVIDTRDPERELENKKRDKALLPPDITALRNQKDVPTTLVERDSAAQDYYNKTDPFAVRPWQKRAFESFMKSLSEQERRLLSPTTNFYELEFENIGGLVMPIILEITFADNTKEIHRFPAEIWRYNNHKVKKVVMTTKQAISFTVDPYLETADTDLSNNSYPRKQVQTRFQLFKNRQTPQPNPMQLERQEQLQTKPSAGTN
ncbi:MAG: M1 family metallopeptidase [Bacteroidota bacterium]|nr:M1 family metallopeptidase [Candidatus Kapabacteria bacterium]MDW8220585.1 M1 family metallopeptidase [Bacteroidota bacterium]